MVYAYLSMYESVYIYARDSVRIFLYVVNTYFQKFIEWIDKWIVENEKIIVQKKKKKNSSWIKPPYNYLSL